VKIVLNFLIIFVSVIIIGATAIYIVEMRVDSQINSPLDAVWWTVATITTVGYGDVVPETTLGRIIGIVYMFFGVTMMAVTISIVGTNIYKRRFEQDEAVSVNQKTILDTIKKLQDNQKEINQSLKEIKESLKQNKE
jgi:voltage-gated potassium channel